MDNKIKKQLINIVTSHLKHILEISKCKDSNIHKILAIQMYCIKSLEIIEKTVKPYLED